MPYGMFCSTTTTPHPHHLSPPCSARLAFIPWGPCPAVRVSVPFLPVLTPVLKLIDLARVLVPTLQGGLLGLYFSVLSPRVLVPRDYSGHLCPLPIFPALRCAHLDPLSISQSEGQDSFCAWQMLCQGLMKCRCGLCPMPPDTQMTHALWIL